VSSCPIGVGVIFSSRLESEEEEASVFDDSQRALLNCLLLQAETQIGSADELLWMIVRQ